MSDEYLKAMKGVRSEKLLGQRGESSVFLFFFQILFAMPSYEAPTQGTNITLSWTAAFPQCRIIFVQVKPNCSVISIDFVNFARYDLDLLPKSA